MVSACLPSDALLQHLPSYLGFSYLGCGVSLHGWPSQLQGAVACLDAGGPRGAIPHWRQEYWSGLPFPSPVDHILSDLSTMTRPSWVAPQAWLSFIELDEAVVLVWLDSLVFFEYGFSVSALWCPLATPTVLLGFLLLWVWSFSSRLLQQNVAAAPYLGWGVSPHRCPFWPWTWNSSSRPSSARAATVPWRWDCSSRPQPLASDMR